MKLSVVDRGALIDEATRTFATAIARAIQERRTCSFALSRPQEGLLERLSASDVDWSSVHVFQVDERVAPDEHPDRNLTLIERDLPDAATMHAMPVTDRDVDAAAARYERELVSVCGKPPVLDVVHLGLGPDGHTASLLPGEPVLDVRDRAVAVTGEAAGYRRMTLTYPALDAARLIVFVVSGAEKADALARVLDGDESAPAARLRARDVRTIADTAAAPQKR